MSLKRTAWIPAYYRGDDGFGLVGHNVPCDVVTGPNASKAVEKNYNFANLRRVIPAGSERESRLMFFPSWMDPQ